jgi:hypothetical protein
MSITLTLSEVVSLFIELNGDGKAFKGLLKQKMGMKQKALLHRLEKVVREEMQTYESLRKELFEKHGNEPDKTGSITVPPENIEAFKKELDELMATEKPLNISTLWTTPLTLTDLESVETDEYYPTVFKILEHE